MTTQQQLNIESFKEGNRLEAKLAKDGVPASLWEAYTSFANTDGGLILLGVKENKNHTFAIEGIDNPIWMVLPIILWRKRERLWRKRKILWRKRTVLWRK